MRRSPISTGRQSESELCGRFDEHWTARNRSRGRGPISRRILRHAPQSSLKLRFVTVQDCHDLVVLEVSEPPSKVSFTQKAKVCKQLAQPHVRRQSPHLG